MDSIIRKLAVAIFLIAITGLMPGKTLAGQVKHPDFKILKTVPLEGGGRWDYVNADSNSHRVYIARSTHVTVVDSETGEVIGDIPDTKGVHGVAVAQDFGVGFLTAGGENKVVVFDLKTLQVVSRIDTGAKPDSILYHPATHLMFVQNGDGQSSTVIDVQTKKVVATIPLGGAPEFAAYDENGNIFINLENTGSIVVIDVTNKKLKNTWKIRGCEAPSGLALDQTNHTLFSACTESKLLAVVSSENGKLLQTLPIGADCDALGFDPSNGNVFASTGDGHLMIFHRDASGKYALVQNLDTPPGSKTMGYDAATHKVYLPSAKFTGDPLSKPRPTTVPGSVQVLVIGQQ